MKRICSFFTGLILGIAIFLYRRGERYYTLLRREKVLTEKHLALFLLLYRFMKIKQAGINIADYFTERGYEKIAVYGMSYVGNLFVNELKDSKVEILFGIDNSLELIYPDIPVFTLEESEFNEVDVVVVTAVTAFNVIETKLSNKANCLIVSLSDILDEV